MAKSFGFAIFSAFCNSVTRWNEAWLNEGLASYCSALVQAELEPGTRAWERLLGERTMQVG